jgi:RHS repeat-associated protein
LTRDSYVYDLSDQLIKVLSGSNQVAEYTFNGAGQRIKKWAPTETRIFHYDLQGHLIAETNQSGQMIAEYIYLGDQLLAMIKPGNQAYYYHNDHLGTPQVLTDATGNIAWKAAYNPFGEATISVQAVENPFRFPGQYYDSETGLHYNYFRYYDPTTGRYVTPDPIGLDGGINLFVYALDNPLNLVDPEGLQQFPPGEIRPIWGSRRESPNAPVGGRVQGRNRGGGIFCTCVWDRVGFEKIDRDPCGKITRKEPMLSISDPNKNMETTQGIWTQSGCLCADPNGELQLR